MIGIYKSAAACCVVTILAGCAPLSTSVRQDTYSAAPGGVLYYLPKRPIVVTITVPKAANAAAATDGNAGSAAATTENKKQSGEKQTVADATLATSKPTNSTPATPTAPAAPAPQPPAKSASDNSVQVAAGEAYPDTSCPFVLSTGFNLVASHDVTIGVNEKGLLNSDSTASITGSLSEAFKTLASSLASVRASSMNIAAADVPANVQVKSVVDEAKERVKDAIAERLACQADGQARSVVMSDLSSSDSLSESASTQNPALLKLAEKRENGEYRMCGYSIVVRPMFEPSKLWPRSAPVGVVTGAPQSAQAGADVARWQYDGCRQVPASGGSKNGLYYRQLLAYRVDVYSVADAAGEIVTAAACVKKGEAEAATAEKSCVAGKPGTNEEEKKMACRAQVSEAKGKAEADCTEAAAKGNNEAIKLELAPAQSYIAFSPDAAPVAYLPMAKALFASANTNSYTFNEGIPTKYGEEADGELVALLKLPADVIGAYFEAIGTIVGKRKTNLGDEKEYINAVSALALARYKDQVCKAALDSKDSDKISKACGQ